jgi:hypothetical protein
VVLSKVQSEPSGDRGGVAHPRLHLFAKLEYHSGVGSLKDLKVSQLIEVPDFFWKLTR